MARHWFAEDEICKMAKVKLESYTYRARKEDIFTAPTNEAT